MANLNLTWITSPEARAHDETAASNAEHILNDELEPWPSPLMLRRRDAPL